MHNLRPIFFALVMTGSVLACSFVGTPAAPDVNVATVVAATLQAITPAAPTPTATTAPPQGVPVSYKNVSFVLPPGLAADAAPQTVPALTDNNAGPGWDLAPEHVSFRLDSYNAPAGHFTPINIDIYPAQAYANVNAGANIGLQRLQGVLGNPAGALTNDNLPQVPYFNAASMFAAQIKRVHFQSGDGVRFITQYGQGLGPIGNFGTFYHFEGLTADGKYYIVAVLPITAPFLQSVSDPSAPLPEGGVPFPGNNYSDPAKYFNDYAQAIANKLDSTPPDQFTPTLTTLDALAESIAVSP